VSRIGEQLQRLHKPMTSLGFGFATASTAKRRMLVVVRVNESLDEQQMTTALVAADAAVVVPGSANGDSLLEIVEGQHRNIPLGVWVCPGPDLPAEAAATYCDFLVCDIEGPADAVVQKTKGCLMRVEPGMEASRLRAIAEIGADAIVVAADTLDLTRLSALVECRRAHALSGKPVVLQIRDVLDEAQVVALWRSGVDALLFDASVGAEVLAGIRATVDSASFEARDGSSGASPTIGAHVGALSQSDAGDADGGDGGEDDDDDDE